MEFFGLNEGAFMKKTLILSAIAMTLTSTGIAFAATPITVINSKYHHNGINDQPLIQVVKDHLPVDRYAYVRIQGITNKFHEPDHLLVYLHSKQSHKVELARLDIDKKLNFVAKQFPYRLQASDNAQQPGISVDKAKCPDNSIEFIAFAPNGWSDFEIKITKDVAKFAKSHGLKTVTLLDDKATRSSYLNYMSCPHLVGNFYDGDADPDLITTYDGELSAADINSKLLHSFDYKVTNIWLACQAYNDPMKTAMLDAAESQKYAAGVNNLKVGPSDYAAACAMKAAIKGKPMKEAFDNCYSKKDDPEDIWGWGGNGANIFAT